MSWIRELLDVGVLQAIRWCDTRDMTADGRTKGCIYRKLLLEVMTGNMRYEHPVKDFRPKTAQK
eukprot:9393432-Lingulodinium_polyedra.AAC.1